MTTTTADTTRILTGQPLAAERLGRLRAWSYETFGPGPRLGSGIKHLHKELDEAEAKPEDITEWADIVILALSTAMRQGHEPQDILDAVVAKMDANELRKWPDWRAVEVDTVIEHVRD